MNIKNNYNIMFSGRLILQGNSWNKLLKDAVQNNPVINNVLKHNDRDLFVLLKHKDATDYEIYTMGRDADLYKMVFCLKKDAKSLFGKIISFFNSKRAILTSKYHSEDTLVAKLLADDELEDIFTKHKFIK